MRCLLELEDAGGGEVGCTAGGGEEGVCGDGEVGVGAGWKGYRIKNVLRTVLDEVMRDCWIDVAPSRLLHAFFGMKVGPRPPFENQRGILNQGGHIFLKIFFVAKQNIIINYDHLISINSYFCKFFLAGCDIFYH